MQNDKNSGESKKKGIFEKFKENIDDKARKRADGTMKADKNNQPTFNKADFEKLIEKAAQTAPTQILRIEQAPIKIVTEASDKDNVSKT